jgi:hypothetical protein
MWAIPLKRDVLIQTKMQSAAVRNNSGWRPYAGVLRVLTLFCSFSEVVTRKTGARGRDVCFYGLLDVPTQAA